MYFKHNGVSSTKIQERVCWGVQAAMILTLVSKRVMQGCRANSSGWRLVTVIRFLFR